MRLRGVATVLTGAARNLYYGNGADWAASLAYYSLLSVFPAALLLERQGLEGNTAPPPPAPSESEQMP